MSTLYKIAVIMLMGCSVASADAQAFGLKDAVQKALHTTYAKNADLMTQVVKLDRQLAQKIYDPIMTLDLGVVSDESKKSNPFMPGVKGIEFNAGYDRQFSTGTVLSVNTGVATQTQVFEGSSDIDFYETGISVGVEQDIWRNAFGRQDKLVLTAQDLQSQLAVLEIMDVLEETVYQSTVIFWGLVFAEKNLEANRVAMANAKRLYDLQLKKSKTGLSENRIVYAFKANWLSQKLAYEQALHHYESAKDQFMTALELTQMPKIDDDMTVYLNLVQRASFEYDWSSQQAYLRRYQGAQLMTKHRDVMVKKVLDNVKPKLVVYARAGYNGIDSKLGESMSQALEFSHLNAQAGVRMRINGGRSSQYEVQREMLERMIDGNELSSLTQDLQFGLKDAGRLVKLRFSELGMTEDIERVLHQKYQEDLRQFEVGRIDVDELLQSQNHYVQAQLGALKAKYDYLQMVGAFFRAENTLLSKIRLMELSQKPQSAQFSPHLTIPSSLCSDSLIVYVGR